MQFVLTPAGGGTAIDGGTVTTGTTVDAATNTADYSVSFDTTKVPDGSYTLVAIATDTSGRTVTSAARTLAVANPAPGAGGGGGTGGGTGGGGGSAGTGGGKPSTVTASVRLRPQTLSLSTRGRIGVKVRCTTSNKAACVGRVTLRTAGKIKIGSSRKAPRRILTLGTVAVRIAAGKEATVNVPVSTSVRRVLARYRSLSLRATLDLTAPLKRRAVLQAVLPLKLGARR